MGELVSYTIRLIAAAIVGAIAALAVGAVLVSIVGLIDGGGHTLALDSTGPIVGLGALAAGLAATRLWWARWLRPQDRQLEYRRRAADDARRGLPPLHDGESHKRAAPLTPTGVVLIQRNRQVEVSWSDVREIRIRTVREMLAGPFFLLVKTDGETLTVPHEEMALVVLARMQQLSDFRNDVLVQAMGSTDDAEFSCWRRAG